MTGLLVAANVHMHARVGSSSSRQNRRRWQEEHLHSLLVSLVFSACLIYVGKQDTSCLRRQVDASETC